MSACRGDLPDRLERPRLRPPSGCPARTGVAGKPATGPPTFPSTRCFTRLPRFDSMRWARIEIPISVRPGANRVHGRGHCRPGHFRRAGRGTAVGRHRVGIGRHHGGSGRPSCIQSTVGWGTESRRDSRGPTQRALVLLRRVGGKWGLAPWRKLVWQREKRCRHGACPPSTPAASTTAQGWRKMGTGSVAQVGLAAGETLPPRCLAGWPWAVARPGLPQIRTWTH